MQMQMQMLPNQPDVAAYNSFLTDYVVALVLDHANLQVRVI